jgi:hypothetical protein
MNPGGKPSVIIARVMFGRENKRPVVQTMQTVLTRRRHRSGDIATDAGHSAGALPGLEPRLQALKTHLGS